MCVDVCVNEIIFEAFHMRRNRKRLWTPNRIFKPRQDNTMACLFISHAFFSASTTDIGRCFVKGEFCIFILVDVLQAFRSYCVHIVLESVGLNHTRTNHMPQPLYKVRMIIILSLHFLCVHRFSSSWLHLIVHWLSLLMFFFSLSPNCG